MEGILSPHDMASRTSRWIQDMIGDERLSRITLILAGRPGDKGRTFKAVERAVGECSQDEKRFAPRAMTTIPVLHLTQAETREFFRQLKRDWRARQSSLHSRRTAQQIADIFQHIAEGEQYRTIWLYSEGIPIHLALCAQVIADGKNIPEPLRRPAHEAFAEVGLTIDDAEEKLQSLDDAQRETRRRTLRVKRWEIEQEFLDLLFSGETDLEAQVLLALVRAPRGLSAEQIHFYLDSHHETAEEWRPDQDRLDTICDAMERIQSFYLGKRYISWEELEPVPGLAGPDRCKLRVGLQEEIYQLYSEHMGLWAYPFIEDHHIIDDFLTDEARRQNQTNWEDEVEARQSLYQKLSVWADFRYEQLLKLKRQRLAEDERALEQTLRIDDPRTFAFPALSYEETKERAALNAGLAMYEVERMIYQLLLEPLEGFNASYIALEDDNDKAGRQEEDFWAQSERWRLIHDDDLMRFVRFKDYDPASDRNKEPLNKLRRLAREESMIRWLKRFTLRGQYDRAIRYAVDVQAYLDRMPPDYPRNELFSQSWTHPLSECEREIWKQLAYLRSGQQPSDKALQIVTDCITQLEAFHQTDTKTEVPATRGRVEYGFRGHPGATRVRRLLSYAHNTLGYGYRVQGQMKEAVDHYGRALDYIRSDVGSVKPYRASVLNNLSRALSELGWPSTSVCIDGLMIRREMAEEAPLASSYNTLALIYDDMARYEDAPPLSAKAVAYCRRSGEPRQLGLALRQMGESLRHLAHRIESGQRFIATPDSFYSAAEALLNESRHIFTFHLRHEPEPLIDVTIELGSLYRDRMRPRRVDGVCQSPPYTTDHYRHALEMLDAAEQMAKERNLVHYWIDAVVNRARIHYYGGQVDEAKAELTAVRNHLLVSDYLIAPGKRPAVADGALRNRGWVFLHLSAAQMLDGWMAFDRFEERVNFFKEEYPHDSRKRQAEVARDPVAQAALRAAAEAYTLGLAYSQYYSPRSRSINTLFDDLYSRLLKSNITELASFRRQLEKLKGVYHDLDSLDLLIMYTHEFFGLTSPYD
jgi:hypothetical protein